MTREKMRDLWERYARAVPWKLLLPLTLPFARQLKTRSLLSYEDARMLETAFELVYNNGVRGDYLEFGVYEGRSFLEAWDAANRYLMRDMHFYAFDSFTGLPEIGPDDVSGPFTQGQFHAPRALFESNLRRHRVDLRRVTVVEGMFQETLNATTRKSIRVDRAAIAWIDCDLYASTVPVLDFLSDVLVDGAVLTFDDWYCFNGRPDRGEQRACSEWLSKNPHIRLVGYQNYHWGGRSFIVNRDDRT